MSYTGYYYEELPCGAKAACASLGYTEKIWNEGATPAACQKFYDELSDEQQDALAILGYSKAAWDGTPLPTTPTSFDGTPLPSTPTP